MIYFDHNATTPPVPVVVQAMLSVMTDIWGNASSQHAVGQQARAALATARSTIARGLACKSSEIVFTSGATEANHLAVLGIHAALPPTKRRLIFSAVEHAGQMKLARALAARGIPVDYIAVHADGSLDLTHAQDLMGPDVALVSLLAANNETGVLMPVAQVRDMAHAVGAYIHVDATQIIGKLPFHFEQAGVDAVSMSAHKLSGPKGIGALLLRQGVTLVPEIWGSQERHRRGGTENLPAIAGFAAAVERLHDLRATSDAVSALRDALESGLQRALPTAVHIYSKSVPRLPGTSFLRFGQLPAELVLQRLSRLGVAASSGSACASSGNEPSHVLSAMGVSRDEALAAVRLSLGETTTLQDIQYVLAHLPPMLRPLLEEASYSA